MAALPKFNVILLFISLSCICNIYAQHNNIEVLFADIENVPIFPGCKKGDNNKKKNCMSNKISMFVGRNFNTNIAANCNLEGRQRINVLFKIDKSGNIVDIQSRGPHPALEKEAVRVISMLPKMEPGMRNNIPVIVQYSLPIVFEVTKTIEGSTPKKKWTPGDNKWTPY